MRGTVTASLALLAATSLAAATPVIMERDFTPPAWDTWIWTDQGGNVCADGSQTGFAYNMHQGASELLIYFDGGGACWDTNSCFTNPSAAYLNGYNNATFQANSRPALEQQILLTSRDPARNNPWAAAHHVFVPYCTGDIHGGNAVVTYPGAPAPINHHGYANFQTILQVVASSVPSMSNIWITGTSAGCFGATMNYISAKKAWPWSRTHLIADSCATTPGFLNTKPQWNLQQPSTSDCPKCQRGEFNTWLPALSLANRYSRFGAMFYQTDSTLPGFFGDSWDDFAGIIKNYFANITATPTNQAKTFTDPHTQHGVLYQISPVSVTGVPLYSWLANMKNLRSVFKSV